MTGNLVLRVGVLLLGLFVAVMTTFEVLTDYRNNLSTLFRYVTLGAFLVGFVNPRIGIYLLLFICAYLDFCKRLLVYFGRVYFDDVFVVLSVAPLMFAGICSGLLFSRTRSRRLFRGHEWGLFAVVVVLELLVMAKMAQGAAGMRDANLGIFIPMLLFAGMLFSSSKEQRRYIRVMLLIFVPVAFYGMKQAIYGYNAMELMYMETGLTVVKGGLNPDEAIRPFSTLNSEHAFSAMMAILFTFSLYEAVYAGKARVLFWLLCIVYLAGLGCSLVRTYWFMAAAMPFCFIAFRRRNLTAVFYGVVVTTGATIVVSAGWLVDNIEKYTIGKDASSDWVRRALTLGTYGDRLEGFENWLNPQIWSLFGLSGQTMDERVAVHDVIGGTLVAYGAVGLLLILAVVVSTLYFAHSRVLSISDRGDRGLCVCYLSVIFLFFASGVGSGGSFHVYPLNYMLWFSSGCLATILFASAKPARRQVAPNMEVETAPDPTVAGAGDPDVLGGARVVLKGRKAGQRGFPFRASGRVARPDFGRVDKPAKAVEGDSEVPRDGGASRFRPVAGSLPPRGTGSSEASGLSTS